MKSTLLFLAIASFAIAGTINVPADFNTIQEAITAAVDGDTVAVATGTYDESLYIDKPLTIKGESSENTFITGGIVIEGGQYSGLTFDSLYLSGDADGNESGVIDASPVQDYVGDITIKGCILDGNNIESRKTFCGILISGIWIWDNNEIKNINNWSVISNTDSYNSETEISHIIFTNNYVHDVTGAIAFRGKQGQEIETARISGNIADYSMYETSDAWAFVEVNKVLNVEITNNIVNGVPESAPTPSGGVEGQAFQAWSTAPWVLEMYDNDISGNYQGVAIALESRGDGELYIPSGFISNNNFSNATNFALTLEDWPIDGEGNTAGNLGDSLNVNYNYWGPEGPDGLVFGPVQLERWYIDEGLLILNHLGSNWFVSPDGADMDGYGSDEYPFATIQYGIDASVDGDIVSVAAGTYIENINFNGKNIVVQGEDKETTIIDGNQDGSVVTFEGGEDSTAVLSDFTIMGGNAYDGGGIYCTSSFPKVTNNIITGNISETYGGGISCNYSSAVIINNTITFNSSLYGGGISFDRYTSSVIRGNNISENTAEQGGGIGCFTFSSPTITNNTIFGNLAITNGGGVYCYYVSSPNFANTIIWDNAAPIDSNISVYSADPLFNYCDVMGGWEGQGNIDANPLFCDSENGDYHLRIDSPCVSTGQDGANIGAMDVECGLLGDVNFDEIINIQDVIMTISYVLEIGDFTPEQIAAADINGDDIINILDVILMVNVALG